MIQPGVATRRPRARLLVQHDEVLVAGSERRDGPLAPVQAQAEAVLVEGDRAVEPGDGEGDGAQSQRGRRHRREAKKSVSSAAHSSRSSPPATAGRWLKRRSPSTSSTLPAAPALGSAVP